MRPVLAAWLAAALLVWGTVSATAGLGALVRGEAVAIGPLWVEVIASDRLVYVFVDWPCPAPPPRCPWCAAPPPTGWQRLLGC
jgi:hypothetical protein